MALIITRIIYFKTFIDRSYPKIPCKTLNKNFQLVWFVVGFINVILILRVVFLLFNAQTSGFTGFLYNVTSPFVMPFLGIFPAPTTGVTYFDTAALVAIIIYSLVAWGAVTLIRIISSRQEMV